MCVSRKFFQRGSNLDNVFSGFFSVDGGGRILIPLWAGHHRPASEMPLKWGSGPVLLRNPMFLCFSGGGGSGSSVPPSVSAHVSHLFACWVINHAFVIGCWHFSNWTSKISFRNITCIQVSNGLDLDQDRRSVLLVLIWVQTVCKGYQKSLIPMEELKYRNVYVRLCKQGIYEYIFTLDLIITHFHRLSLI